MLCLLQSFKSRLLRKWTSNSLCLLLLIPFFFPALHHNCLTCLFSERDIMTTWKCWVKVYICIYTVTGHSISENQAGSPTLLERTRGPGKTSSFWFVLSEKCYTATAMNWTPLFGLYLLSNKAALVSEKHKHPDISAEVQPECWIKLKVTEIHLQLQSFFPTGIVQVCAGWWKCEIQLTWHFLDMRYLNYIKNSISEPICKTSFLHWVENRHHTET